MVVPPHGTCWTTARPRRYRRPRCSPSRRICSFTCAAVPRPQSRHPCDGPRPAPPVGPRRPRLQRCQASAAGEAARFALSSLAAMACAPGAIRTSMAGPRPPPLRPITPVRSRLRPRRPWRRADLAQPVPQQRLHGPPPGSQQRPVAARRKRWGPTSSVLAAAVGSTRSAMGRLERGAPAVHDGQLRLRSTAVLCKRQLVQMGL
mmetsp:Transcript_14126/g.38736  ORF Transcript_14126/g.38736 Transcript_14126/m.38736 type:complete len:204 (-) Transcript_14126:56-667(-)